MILIKCCISIAHTDIVRSPVHISAHPHSSTTIIPWVPVPSPRFLHARPLLPHTPAPPAPQHHRRAHVLRSSARAVDRVFAAALRGAEGDAGDEGVAAGEGVVVCDAHRSGECG